MAMHQYFIDLHLRSHRNKANYTVILAHVYNMIGGISYGNCAWWTAQGLRQAGLLPDRGTMIPKALWIDMYEHLRCSQQEALVNNVNVVYYKYVAQRLNLLGRYVIPH
jgi:hypothetical protein